MEKVVGTLRDIKPGSVVFVWGHGFIATAIGWYQKVDIHVKDTPGHVELYFGSGDNLCVSAESSGVKRVKLASHLCKGHKVEVYSNKNITVDQMQQLKDFAYSRVDVVPYDFLGVVSFLGNLLHIPLPQKRSANFCSELVADCFAYIGMHLVKDKKLKSGQQHPGMQWDFIRNSKAWQLDYSYTNLE